MNNYKLLRFLVGAQSIGMLIFFPYYALFLQESIGLKCFAIVLAGLTILNIWGVVTRKPWTLWLVLTVLSLKLTLDLFAWSTHLDRSFLQVLSQGINFGIILLAFKAQVPVRSTLSRLHKVFYGFVLGLALLIGIYGLLIPEQIIDVLPFSVPPLHARFLGSMYLSGVAFMGFSMMASDWSEVRVVTPMITIWTGMLGLISLLYLDAFDWSRVTVWVWFIAYSSYPLIAAWITWQQRSQTEHPPGLPLSKHLRSYFLGQGIIVTILALCLLLAPAAMVKVWPWNITPLLAHIYSAPFLSYGLGSLCASTQKRWQEVRIVIYATLVFTTGVLSSSFYHRGLFDFHRLSVWVWFGGFTLTCVALALFGVFPSLHNSSTSHQENA